MKTLSLLILAAALLASISNSFACRNQVPESEAIRYHESALKGEGVPGGVTCADKPKELCMCFDHCEDWDVCEPQDVEEIIKLPGGKEEKTITRKLVNNLEKMAEKRKAKDIEANHKEISDAKKKMARECILEFQPEDLDSATTIATLKQRVKSILQCVVEVIK